MKRLRGYLRKLTNTDEDQLSHVTSDSGRTGPREGQPLITKLGLGEEDFNQSSTTILI